MKPIRLRSVLELVQLEARETPAVDVLTYHYDLQRAGANLAETALTRSNVNSADFGKLYASGVDGQVYGQPLYKSDVTITVGEHQGVHNVVYVATEHDSVYAFDADNGVLLWHTSYIDPANGVTTVPYAVLNSGNILPEVGITSTGVIDPATNTLYISAATKEVIGGQNHYVQRLHAIDLGSGLDKAVTVVGDTVYDGTSYTYVSGPSVAGTGDGAVNGVVTFNALRQNQRAALTLVDGVVYLAYASHETVGPYHGWILGYTADDLELAAVFNTTPNSTQGGIWQSGDGLAVDPDGYLYALTGNGRFSTTLDANGFPIDGSYGDSLIKLERDGSTAANPNINGWGLKVVDYFTPFNQHYLDQYDTDLGSGGPMVLPDAAGSTAHPHLIVFGGKEGTVYLVDRDDLGKYDGAADNVVQVLKNTLTSTYDTPAYFNNTVYFVGAKNADRAKSYSISNAAMSPSPTTVSADTYGYPGATPVVTANGSTNGIVWTVNTGTNSLNAYSSDGFNTLLYSSTQAANGRDALGPTQKFATPIVANGRAYVGTASGLVVYGLLTPPTVAPGAPTGLTATAISSAQVALGWAADPDNYGANESGVDIEGSTNGGPFTLIGTAAAHATSYTVGGLDPSVTYSFRVRARNGVGPSAYSNTATATTGPAVGAGGVDFSGGFGGAGSSLALNGNTTVTGSTLRLTDGAANVRGSAFTATKVNVGQFTTRFSFRQTNAIADGFTFTLQNAAPTALGQGSGSLGYGDGYTYTGGRFVYGVGIPASAAIKFDLYNSNGEGPNSAGLYLNGAAPTNIGARDLTAAGIDLHSGHLFNAVIGYDGTTLTLDLTDTVTGATYRTSWTVDLVSALGGPTAYVGFTGASGGYTATQDVYSWTYAPTALAGAPSGLTANAVSSTGIDLSWTASAGTVTGYKVERSLDGGATYLAVGTTAGTTYADTTLSPNTTAFYRVRATNAAGESAPSNAASATTVLAPSTPSGATVTYVNATEIDLSWVDNANNETGFQIRRKTGTGTFALVATLPPNTTTFRDTAVAPGTAYDYHIYAVNASGSSDFTGVIGRTLPATAGVDFAGGFAYTSGALKLNGSAALSGTNLRLTNGGTNQSGSAFTTNAVDVTAFATAFRYQPNAGAAADGFAFVLQAAGSSALGSYGGGLGYEGIGKSVAVKFDLYSNAGEGPNSTGLYVNGAVPSRTDAVFLTSAGIDFHSGHAFDIAITYRDYKLTVTITDAVTGVKATQVYSIDISYVLGGKSGYVGFTGGTGGLTATQDIANWTFASTPPLAGVDASAGFWPGMPLVTNGRAGVSQAAVVGDRLRLTAGLANEATSAFAAGTVGVAAFNTQFDFQLTNPQADGFTFVVAGRPTAVGHYGGGLGVGGVAQSVAVAFDLYDNAGEGSNSLGLLVNGYRSGGATDLTASGLDLHSGHVFRANLSYGAGRLTVTLTDLSTGARGTFGFDVDVPMVIGGSRAFVGFTAGTGGLKSTQEVLNWKFSN